MISNVLFLTLLVALKPFMTCQMSKIKEKRQLATDKSIPN